MTSGQTVRPEAPEVYVERIAEHVAHVIDDPWHHLLSIERLARAARAEWWASQQQAEREKRAAP
jgi:hypothetical protein